MKSRICLFQLIFFLALLFILIPSQHLIGQCQSNTIRVPQDYSTIQEAINNTDNGSTIQVDKGIYHEHLMINKSITIMGADRQDTIIDGSNNGTCVNITANNVIFEGFTVQHSALDNIGVSLDSSTNTVIHDNIMTLNGFAGITLNGCSNDTIDENIISSTTGGNTGLFFGGGIHLYPYSVNNTISNNVIVNCTAVGVSLDECSDNVIVGNTLEGNGVIIQLALSSGNLVYHNNFFVNNNESDLAGSNNTWNLNGQGNYWSDYTGLDDGSNNRTAEDGIGDTNLFSHRVDYYPLISPVNPVRVCWDNKAFLTDIVSNSTISSFNFDQPDKQITFNITQPANTIGYFNITIPKSLLDRSAQQNWTVLVDGTNITSDYIITEGESYSTIYLSYSGNNTVQIIGGYVIPEYNNLSIVLLMLTCVLTLSLIVIKKKIRLRPRLS